MCYCPTPTLHLNLALTGDGAFIFSLKKTHSVWFISVWNYGDTENVLINHLLLVIPMSYPCHYTNLCPHKPHKHAHTHTHTQRGFSAGVGDALTLSVCVHVCVCVRERASRGVRPKLRLLLGERGPVWIRYRSDDGQVKGLWVFWGMSRRHGRAAFSHAHTGKCSGCRGIRGKCYRMRGGRESAGKKRGFIMSRSAWRQHIRTESMRWPD